MPALLGQSLILEQAYIHTDRKLYASGETVWVKLYVTDALAFRPSSLSAIAYVELWEANGEILFQTKVPLKKGLGTTTIGISPDQETGEYLIRAYTRWMANGSPDNFAHQPIIIFDANQPIPVRDTAQLPADFSKVPPSLSVGNNSVIHPESLQIELELNKTQAESREQLHLEISTKDAQGKPVSANLSLSIAKSFPTEQLLASPYLQANARDTAQQPEADQLPDLYGLNLSGSVLNEFGQAVRGGIRFFSVYQEAYLLSGIRKAPRRAGSVFCCRTCTAIGKF